MEIQVCTDATADELLTAFFTLSGQRLTGRRALRHAAAERDLRRCFEDRVERIFAAEEMAILDAERQFDPLGAAARLAAPHVILKVLPAFLREREWFGDDAEDRRVRIRLAERLLEFLASFPPMKRYPIDPLTRTVRVALITSRAALDVERSGARLRTDARGRRWQG